MATADYPLAIVGGGLASARAIKAYREAGGDGRIALFSKDRELPYHRPPLSKRYLRGEQEREDALVEKESFYGENDVDLHLETAVARVHPGERALELEGGARVRFDRLLVATGAWPRRLETAGGDLAGVFTLRTMEDSTAIRDAARGASAAVLVGAGFIGTEVAASLVQLGLDVTLVHRGEGLFDQFRSPELSRALVDLYRERGVRLLLGEEVRAFHGNGRLASVETRGGETRAAELAVVGVGVEPAVDFLAGSGLELDDGVVVNERFETSAPGVWAVGDVAAFHDPVFGRRRRIEHWSNSNYQGSEVGKILAGGDGGYDAVSTFFTEVFGLTIKLFGDPVRHDRLVVRGSFEEREAIGFYLDGGHLVATVHAGQDEATEDELKELIRARARAAGPELLADRSTPLAAAFS